MNWKIRLTTIAYLALVISSGVSFADDFPCDDPIDSSCEKHAGQAYCSMQTTSFGCHGKTLRTKLYGLWSTVPSDEGDSEISTTLANCSQDCTCKWVGTPQGHICQCDTALLGTAYTAYPYTPADCILIPIIEDPIIVDFE